MSNENENNADIRVAVAEKLSIIGKSKVREIVVTKLVNDEIELRSNSVLKGLNRLSELKNEQKKIKPDQKSLDVDGKVVTETYSPARFDELKKNKDQIEKMEKALQLALEQGDYSKLKGSE